MCGHFHYFWPFWGPLGRGSNSWGVPRRLRMVPNYLILAQANPLFWPSPKKQHLQYGPRYWVVVLTKTENLSFWLFEMLFPPKCALKGYKMKQNDQVILTMVSAAILTPYEGSMVWWTQSSRTKKTQNQPKLAFLIILLLQPKWRQHNHSISLWAYLTMVPHMCTPFDNPYCHWKKIKQ